MKKCILSLISVLCLFTMIACSGDDAYTAQQEVAESGEISDVLLDQALEDVEYLASDELEGRRTGTEGSRMAQDYIESRFEQLGLLTFGEDYRHLFDHTSPRSDEEFIDAVNLIGYVEGLRNRDRYIVVTAHYDHLGINDGEIYNGADDNASGTSGLMAAAAYFTENQPENSIIFIAFDAEEQGLGGARHFVENPVVPLDEIVMNINMDMISTNFDDELYAVGTYHYPYLKPMIEQYTADASIDVLFGYDSDEWDQDWTMASDHGPFHQQGVPFVYFGVEDHEHYHAPSDTFENINPEFYRNSVYTIIRVIEGFDRELDQVAEQSDR